MGGARSAVWWFLVLAACVGQGDGAAAAGAGAPQPLRVVSYNIRYGTAQDGANHWRHRRDRLLQQVAAFDAHVLGLQEALAFQIEDLAAALPRHRWIGTDRRGGRADEFVPIFFDAMRLELVEHGMFWLAPDPDAVGAVGWDAALPRACCWAVLAERDGSGRFLVGNAHLDHRGAEARRQGARVVAERLLRRGLPTVLLGDLNAAPDSAPLAVLHTAGLRDAFAEGGAADGPAGTFHAFRGGVGGERIDFVLCDAHWQVLGCRIDHAGGAGPPFPSDHFAVLADLRLVPAARR